MNWVKRTEFRWEAKLPGGGYAVVSNELSKKTWSWAVSDGVRVLAEGRAKEATCFKRAREAAINHRLL